MRNDSDFDNRRLTSEQRVELSRRVMGEAHAARAESLRALFQALFRSWRWLGVPARLVAAAARAWWMAYAAWLDRGRAVRALAALDDRSLKDMGLHRSEIESVVLGRSSAPPRNAAPVSVQALQGKRKRSGAREPERLLRCSAAA